MIEIALMIEIGGWIGVAPTVAAIILTAGIGTGLFRWQGARVLHELRVALEAEVPLAAVLMAPACCLPARCCSCPVSPPMCLASCFLCRRFGSC